MYLSAYTRTAAATVLTYLDTTGDCGRLAREHLVADVVQRNEADPASARQDGVALDGHDALILMRDVFDELVA